MAKVRNYATTRADSGSLSKNVTDGITEALPAALSGVFSNVGDWSLMDSADTFAHENR